MTGYHPGCDRRQRTVTVTPTPQRGPEFDSVLRAIAGHDLRQPLQIIQSAQELLSLGARTTRELGLLLSTQDAVSRLKEQVEQLLMALRVRERGEQVKLTALEVGPFLQQASIENKESARQKEIAIRVVRSSAVVMSDPHLLAVVLRSLVRLTIKETEPGGRILIGCRSFGRSVQLDVYSTCVPGEQMPSAFEAFAHADPVRRDGVGLGVFVIYQAIGLLGHRIDFASTPYRGSRLSIRASRPEQP